MIFSFHLIARDLKCFIDDIIKLPLLINWKVYVLALILKKMFFIGSFTFLKVSKQELNTNTSIDKANYLKQTMRNVIQKVSI